MPAKRLRKNTACCPPTPALQSRPLLTPAQAEELADVFKILANATRLRLLHALVRAGALCVGDLAHAVGMKPQAVPNQLQRLVDQGIQPRKASSQSAATQSGEPSDPPQARPLPTEQVEPPPRE